MSEKDIPPDRALERTASQSAIHFLCVCYRSLACESRSSGLVAADLVFR